MILRGGLRSSTTRPEARVVRPLAATRRHDAPTPSERAQTQSDELAQPVSHAPAPLSAFRALLCRRTRVRARNSASTVHQTRAAASMRAQTRVRPTSAGCARLSVASAGSNTGQEIADFDMPSCCRSSSHCSLGLPKTLLTARAPPRRLYCKCTSGLPGEQSRAAVDRGTRSDQVRF